jgi:hypothetical protein
MKGPDTVNTATIEATDDSTWTVRDTKGQAIAYITWNDQGIGTTRKATQRARELTDNEKREVAKGFRADGQAA